MTKQLLAAHNASLSGAHSCDGNLATETNSGDLTLSATSEQHSTIVNIFEGVEDEDVLSLTFQCSDSIEQQRVIDPTTSSIQHATPLPNSSSLVYETSTNDVFTEFNITSAQVASNTALQHNIIPHCPQSSSEFLNSGANPTPSADNWITENLTIDAAVLEYTQVETVRRLWITRDLETSSFSVEMTDFIAPKVPSQSGKARIDDEYRRSLQRKLQVLSPQVAVPSTDTLNICLGLYFAKVQPLFPLIHPATCQPRIGNSSIIITLCAIGTLFTGSYEYLEQGRYLFESLRRVVLSDMENFLYEQDDSMRSVIKSTAMAHLVGIISGSAKNLLSVDAFHGIALAWARQEELHRGPTKITLMPEANDAQLEETWKEWIHSEECSRTIHGLFIVDAQVSGLMNCPPLINIDTFPIHFVCSENLWIASNAREWRSMYLEEMQGMQQRPVSATVGELCNAPENLRKVPSTSCLTALVILEALCSQISSMWDKMPRSESSSPAHFCNILDAYFEHFFAAPFDPHEDHLQLKVRWHSAYMAASADFNLLEIAVGREGRMMTADEKSAIEAWSNSDQAIRCILHGLMIRRLVQARPVEHEPAVHVPRALFFAAIAIICFLRFTSASQSDVGSIVMGSDLIFPELHRTGMLPAIMEEFRIHIIVGGNSFKAIALSITDLLRRIGHWEIARRFAVILTALL